MTTDHKSEGRDFAEFIRNLTPETREEVNRKALEQAEQEFQEFKAAFEVGGCYMCGHELTSFDAANPCIHWLLRPAGFTKRHFPGVAKAFSFFQIQSYLRWVANHGAFAQNINDLAIEGTGKFIELTIRYGVYEWAFSCGESDYAGHQTESPDSQVPHYHFQMRVNRAAFIRYNDFHVPFSRQDIHQLEAMRHAPDIIRGRFPSGEGMGDLLHEDRLEQIVAQGKAAPDADQALIKLDTFIVAEPGTAISGDDLAALIEEAKAKGGTLASVVKKLPNVKVQTMISPGPGVVEQAPRSGRGRGKPDAE